MSQKHMTKENLIRLIEQWRVKSNTIVFTNGCFDILHAGHIQTLQEAKKLGDKLVVGLNSNASVKKLKGNDRPVNSEENRALLLQALSCVDAVVLFEEDTPLKLIEIIQPDVLVKGGDWQIEKIVGADFVLNNGGIVKSIPFVEGLSSSSILDKILKL